MCVVMRWTNFRAACSDDRGSMLIEVMMAAMLVGVLAVGVMGSLNTSVKVSGNQKSKAVAGAIAEAQLEMMRGYNMTQISAVGSASTSTQTVGGVTYTITNSATWVGGTANQGCTDSDAVTGGNTYLKIRSSVTWNGASNPVKLDSIYSPAARNLSKTYGSLVMRFKDIDANPVSGVAVTLTSSGQTTQTGTTDSNGCVAWMTIPAATWAVSASKSGYVTTDGSATLTDSINVGSQQTANINYTLAPKINITVNFFRGTSTATAPAKYIIEHPNITNGYMVVTNAGNASTVTTPDLPKSSTAYTIYAGACQNGSVPGTYKGSAAVATTISVKVPQIDMTTKHNGSADAQDTVVTDSSCPANSRSFVTTNAGKAPNPAQPWASSYSVCTDYTAWNLVFPSYFKVTQSVSPDSSPSLDVTYGWLLTYWALGSTQGGTC